MTRRLAAVGIALGAVFLAVPAGTASATEAEIVQMPCPPSWYPRFFLYSPLTGEPLVAICWPWP